MDDNAAWERFTGAQVARMATIGLYERPHIVPIVFAVLGERTIVTAVDAKPKTTIRLKRLDNIARRPDVSVLVDHYADDWEALWWVRADGTATTADASPELVAPLVAKYPQYAAIPPAGPVIVIDIKHIRHWQSSSG